MTTPQPGMTLDLAERWARQYADRPDKERRREVVALLAEYDHRGERITNLEAGREVEQHMLRNAALRVEDAERRLDQVTVESIRLLAQRDAILALHKRNEIGEQVTCGHCSIAGLRNDVPVQLAVTLWPCPTVQALGGAS